MKTAEKTNPVDTADEIIEDAEIASSDRAAKKAKLKKLLLIGGAVLGVTAVAAIVVAKTRGSSLPEITDVLPQ